MRCPQCASENRAGGRFCTACGTALAVECEVSGPTAYCVCCGQPLQPGARFCPGCGTGLRAAAPSAGRRRWLIGGGMLAGLLLLGVAGWLYYAWVLKSDGPTGRASVTPMASATVEILYPARSSGVTPIFAASTPSAVEMPAAVPGGPASAPLSAPTQLLSLNELQSVLAQMKNAGPQPINCADAEQILGDVYGVPAAQTAQAARRGYPALCAASSAKTGPSPAVPPPAAARSKSIDDLYSERSAAECARGFTGVICRERLKLALCDGRWSSKPPPGQSLCIQYESKP